MIPEPLWSLMVSTNDCYPGCACELDVFHIEKSRIREWSDENPEDFKKACEQLEELINSYDINHIEIMEQTNLMMASGEDARDWLLEWKEAMPLRSVGSIR